ncbi:MAG: hypothetical protein ACLTSX_13400 [Collinsella sp.]
MPKLIEDARHRASAPSHDGEGASPRPAEPSRERCRARAKTLLTILAALVLAPLTAVAGMAVPGNGYYLSGTLIVLLRHRALLRRAFEGRRPTAREIAVVAVLTALAVAAPRGVRLGAALQAHGRHHYDRRASPPAPRPVSSWARWRRSPATSSSGKVPGRPLADARLWRGGARGGAACRCSCVPAGEPFLAAPHCVGGHGVRAYRGACGPILDTSTFFYLSTAPTPELAAVVYPRRPAGERDPRGGHGSHAAGCGESAARPARSRACENTAYSIGRVSAPNDDQEDN